MQKFLVAVIIQQAGNCKVKVLRVKRRQQMLGQAFKLPCKYCALRCGCACRVAEGVPGRVRNKFVYGYVVCQKYGQKHLAAFVIFTGVDNGNMLAAVKQCLQFLRHFFAGRFFGTAAVYI